MSPNFLNYPPGFGSSSDLDHMESLDHPACTPERCNPNELALVSIKCSTCGRSTCGSCCINLGDTLYCPECAKCGKCAVKVEAGDKVSAASWEGDPVAVVSIGIEIWSEPIAFFADGGFWRVSQLFVVSKGANSLAVAWCTECGSLLCEHHSAKLADEDLCVECAADRKKADVCEDSARLEIERQQGEPSSEDVPRPWHA